MKHRKIISFEEIKQERLLQDSLNHVELRNFLYLLMGVSIYFLDTLVC